MLRFVEFETLGDESFEGNLNIFCNYFLANFVVYFWKFFFGWKIAKVKDGQIKNFGAAKNIKFIKISSKCYKVFQIHIFLKAQPKALFFKLFLQTLHNFAFHFYFVLFSHYFFLFFLPFLCLID